MRWDNINWGVAGFLISYQVLLLILLPIYLVIRNPHPGLWWTMGVIVFSCGIGVTTLYHRYYSHRAYELSKIPEFIILIFGTLAMQGSVLRWAHDHRLHHRYVDTDKDPYSINKGFWFAHFLWMLEKRGPMDHKVVPDLMKNKLLLFQHKYYNKLLVPMNLAVIVFFGWIFGDYFGAFVLLFLMRLFINHHTTWFINSLAHTWGIQPYSREHSAVNNFIISLLTYGEGYHNYHHTFASDYRNGVRWYQFDPTKLLIFALSKVGLARNLRRIDNTIITRRLLEEDRKLMLEKIIVLKQKKRMTIEEEVQQRIDVIGEKLVRTRKLIKEYRDLKAKKAKAEAKRLHLAIRELESSISADLRAWSKLCDNVLKIKVSSTLR